MSRSKKHGLHQVFLELFSGSARLSRCAQTYGYGAVSLDISMGHHGDLTNPIVGQVVRSWLKSRMICALWIATPCSSWSRARRDLYGGGPRSRQAIFGIPNLSAVDQRRVAAGNATAVASAKFLRAACKARVPRGLENPRNSLLWACPPIAAAVRAGEIRSVDFCSYGAPWRKRTGLCFWGCPPAERFRPLCRGRGGRCSSTGKPRVRLQGNDANNQPRTKTAEPYPELLCVDVWKHLAQAVENNALHRRFQLAKV